MKKIKNKSFIVVLCIFGIFLIACRDGEVDNLSLESSSETLKEVGTTVDYEGKYTYSELNELNGNIAKLCDENKISVNGYGVGIQEELNEYRMLVELAYDATEEEVEEYTSILKEQFGDKVYITKADGPNIPAE